MTGVIGVALALQLGLRGPGTGQSAVESAVADAFRIAPTLEAFVSQPDILWPDALDADALLPARVLKKVAVAPGDTLMQLLTDAGAEPGDSQAAISALRSEEHTSELQSLMRI